MKRKQTLQRLLAIVLCIILVTSCGISTAVAASGNDTVVSPLAEETEWVYRIYNGNYEMRLWSLTYGKWLTDWIIIRPVE